MYRDRLAREILNDSGGIVQRVLPLTKLDQLVAALQSDGQARLPLGPNEPPSRQRRIRRSRKQVKQR